MTENEFDLLHRYLDGAITPEELESLEELLRGDSEARATLRSLATIDAKWQELAANEVVDFARNPSSGNSGESHYANSSSRFWLTTIAIAASLLLAAVGWFRVPGASTGETNIGIARVIRVEGSQDEFAEGNELFSGQQLTLQRGLIELAFRETGVHIIATAPLSMKLDSDQRVSLHEGQVKLVVPPQGVGFVVDTAQRKFVDLGTSFVVTAGATGAEVLVLDGQISVDDHDGTSVDLMHEGEFAKFDQSGKLQKRSPSRESLSLPELTLTGINPGEASLNGRLFGYETSSEPQKSHKAMDFIGRAMLPLIESGFQSRTSLQSFKQSGPVGFCGIAGAYHQFADHAGLAPYARDGGWMAWYHGKVRPPVAGRYRFWGYADNHLLVAIDGKAVFEGSRRESPFKDLGVPRTNNPALPCLIARAGFANSDWIELSGDAVQLDILFGEVGGNITSGLLLVERENEAYDETFWGQPQWPLFLTETPTADEVMQFERLRDHLELRTMGSFSVLKKAVWKVVE